jgi:hypothetical protein
VPATRVPTATPTASPIPATATRAGGLTDIYPQAVVGCDYLGDGISYSCRVQLGWAGQGTGRMTLYYQGQQVGAFNSHLGEVMYYTVEGRRCNLQVYEIELVDDATVTRLKRGFALNPVEIPDKFPGGGCTVP